MISIARTLNGVGGLVLLGLGALKLHGYWAGSLAAQNPVFPLWLLIGVGLVELVTGAFMLRPRSSELCGWAALILGFGFVLATWLTRGSASSCGCVGALAVGFPQRLALGGLVLLVGSLRLIQSGASPATRR